MVYLPDCHPLYCLIAALDAPKENRILSAIQRGLDPVDMHALKEAAGGRPINEPEKQIAHVPEGFRRDRTRHIEFLIVEAGSATLSVTSDCQIASW
jgi:hypothetical protein